MTSFEDFTAQFMEIQEGVIRDHGIGHDRSPLCHVLHRDLGLGETPRDEDSEFMVAARERLGDQFDPADLDFTLEHEQLHSFLSSVMHDALRQGVGVPELIAAMLIIGRRLGLREAAQMLGDFSTDDTSQTA